jgi:tetratricopeptide (TPR) repeat protein
VTGLKFPISLLVTGLVLYMLILVPFTSYMKNKPIEEKLGYVPSFKLLKSLSADQKELVGASLVMKVLMYFGGIIGKAQEGKVIAAPPDLLGMYRMLHGAVQLDPYNMDAYYFAQGFLTWDAHQFAVANNLLEYGMKYRTWDWYLPFFAGFNSAYFMKDYPKAAEYYKRAAELSGQDLHKSLAGRYLQESGQTDLALAYLTAMEKGEKNQAMKKNYQIRLAAFKEVRRIELARDLYRQERGVLPSSVEQLKQSGYLNPSPVDPYGGRFYFEPSGKVATTSKFAFATKNK